MPQAYHKNPRVITRKQRDDLAEWLEELGDISGIVHDLNSDELPCGNQRSDIIDIGQCEIVLTEELNEPDEQGTVAWGYALWNGKKYNYRAVSWTPEQCEKANIIANASGGDWDWTMLASDFDAADLLKWGIDGIDLALKPNGGRGKAGEIDLSQFEQIDAPNVFYRVVIDGLTLSGANKIAEDFEGARVEQYRE